MTKKTQKIAFEDTSGTTLRLVLWSSPQGLIYRNLETNRVEIAPSEEELKDQEIPFESLREFETEQLIGSPLQVGDLKLHVVSEVERVSAATALDDESDETLKKVSQWTTAGHILVLALAFSISLIIGLLEPKKPETTVVTFMQKRPETVPQTVKVRETLKAERRITPKIAKVVQKAQKRAQVAVKPSTKASARAQVAPVPLEEMGALGALGGMISGRKGSAGFQIQAQNSSLGTDLRTSGRGGSSGLSRALHGPGLVSGPIGMNGREGSSGFGGSDKGGGRSGYGSLKTGGGGGGRVSLPLEEEALIEGGLDRDQIAAVVQRNIGQIIYCYEKGLQQRPQLSGRVAVQFIIDPMGNVRTAKINQTSLENPSVEGCIVSKLRGWQFPKPYGNVNVKVTYPFLLKRVG